MGVDKKITDNHDTEEGQGGPDLLALVVNHEENANRFGVFKIDLSEIK